MTRSRTAAQAGARTSAGLLDGDGPETVIAVSGLVKRYGDVAAVRGIDFTVARGETFGFLGPNGAGKSTTIKILCTLATATAGIRRPNGTPCGGTSGWCFRTPRWTHT